MPTTTTTVWSIYIYLIYCTTTAVASTYLCLVVYISPPCYLVILLLLFVPLLLLRWRPSTYDIYVRAAYMFALCRRPHTYMCAMKVKVALRCGSRLGFLQEVGLGRGSAEEVSIVHRKMNNLGCFAEIPGFACGSRMRNTLGPSVFFVFPQ